MFRILPADKLLHHSIVHHQVQYPDNKSKKEQALPYVCDAHKE